MEKYIGLDVHAISCTMAVVSRTGKHLFWKVLETNGEALIAEIMAVPGAVHLCIEEGAQSAWLYEILSPLVAEMVVVGGSTRVRGNKNDESDAFALAELHRTGNFKERKRVYKELGAFKPLRSLVKAYGFITEDVARSKNRVKAVYRSEGVPTKEAGLYREDCRDDWIAKLDRAHQTSAGLLHEVLAVQSALKASATEALLHEARKHASFRLLQTVPGIGPIRAAQIISVVVKPTRFRTRRQFWAYCGFGVVSHTSSDWVRTNGQWKRQPVQQTRGLNKNHNHLLKSVFKSAAMTVIAMDDGNALRRDYERLLKNGTRPNLACLTIARKIAAISLAVWKTETPYKEPATPATQESVEDKASKK